MNQGNVCIKITIVLMSLLLLVNISNANESNTREEKLNKIIPQDNLVSKKIVQNESIPEKLKSEKNVATKTSKKDTQSTLESHSEIGVSNYVQMLFGLFAIIFFIFGVAWIIKRMGTINPSHSSHLKIIAGISVGQREKIVVLQVMEEQFIVGITQSNIQLLNKLEQPIPLQSLNSLGGFQEKLQSAMNSFKKKDESEENR